MHRILAGAFSVSLTGALGFAATALQTGAEGNDASRLWLVAAILGIVALGSGMGWLLTRAPDSIAHGSSLTLDASHSRQSGGVGPIMGDHNTVFYNPRPLRSAVADFSVKPILDGHDWTLEIANRGAEDEFIVEVKTVAAPINWSKRYMLPWREMSSAQNKERQGWQTIPRGSDRSVNLIGWMEKGEFLGVHFGDEPVGPYGVRLYSVTNPDDYASQRVTVGETFDLTVDVHARTADHRIPFTYRVTVESDRVSVVEVVTASATVQRGIEALVLETGNAAPFDTTGFDAAYQWGTYPGAPSPTPPIGAIHHYKRIKVTNNGKLTARGCRVVITACDPDIGIGGPPYELNWAGRDETRRDLDPGEFDWVILDTTTYNVQSNGFQAAAMAYISRFGFNPHEIEVRAYATDLADGPVHRYRVTPDEVDFRQFAKIESLPASGSTTQL